MADASKMELEVKQELGAKEGLDLSFIYAMAEGAIAERDVKDANKMIKMGLEQAKGSKEDGWISKFKSIRSELNDLPPVPSVARVETVKGDLTAIKGIGPSAADKLKSAGINTIAQLAAKTPNQLSKINGIGLETAKKMINSARETEKSTIKLKKGVVIEGAKKSLTAKPRKEVLAVGIDSFVAKPKEVIVDDGKENENKKEKEKEKIEGRIEPELEVKEIFYDKGQEYGVNALVKEPKKNPNKIFTEKEREKEEKEEEKEEEREEDEDYFGLESDYEQEEVKEIKKIDVELEKERFSEPEMWHDVQEKESRKELTPNTASPETSSRAFEQYPENDMKAVFSNFLSSEENSTTMRNNIPKKIRHETVTNSMAQNFTVPASSFQRESARTNVNHNIFSEEQFSIKTMKQVAKKTGEILAKAGYFIVKKRSIEPESVRNRIDLMALKIVNINELLDALVVIPVVISNCRGTLIVSKGVVDYRPKNNLLEMTKSEKKLLTEGSVKNLIIVQDLIFRDLTSKGDSESLRFFGNYLKMDVSVEKTITSKRLFFRSGPLQYKVIIAPVLLCQNNPGFLEKSIPFAYQKVINIHFVGAKHLLEMLDFLEKKYFFVETYSKQENSLTEYFKSIDVFANNIRLGSIPFLGFGLAFLFVLLFQVDFVLVEFVSIGFAAIAIYGVLLSFLWYKFFRKKSAIKDEFNTPYYQRTVKIDESDLHLISEELSPELTEQFTYECFDKDAAFDEILEVEKKKAKKNRFFDGLSKKKALNKQAVKIAGLVGEKKEGQKEKGEEENLRFNSKSVRKYTSFLED